MATFSTNYVTQIKTALLSLFTSNLNTRLQLVNSVGPVSFPESGVFPYVGVEEVNRVEKVIGNHSISSTVNWDISVVVKTTGNMLLQDAVNLRNLVLDDGNNNGVEPILREVNSSLLSGLISRASIGEVRYFTSQGFDKMGSLSGGYVAGAIISWQSLTGGATSF
jgi:hypothetical protein